MILSTGTLVSRTPALVHSVVSRPEYRHKSPILSVAGTRTIVSRESVCATCRAGSATTRRAEASASWQGDGNSGRLRAKYGNDSARSERGFIARFIEAVGSADAPHGAVSTAAVAGGLGAPLLLMVVAALPQTRSDSVADRTKLIEAAAGLTDVQQQLIETIETETAVKLFTARNMPQASDAQRSERQAAIQFALRASADVPLEVMRLARADWSSRQPSQPTALARHRPTFNWGWHSCGPVSTARVRISKAN